MRAAARAFGANGARVAINFRTQLSDADSVAQAVRQHGGQALLDTARRDEPGLPSASISPRWLKAFGRVDVLINNAGALIKRVPVAEYTDEYLDALLDLNVKQVVRFIRDGAIQMRSQGQGGSIINLSSIAAMAAGARPGCSSRPPRAAGPRSW